MISIDHEIRAHQTGAEENPAANRLTLARDFIQRHRRKDALQVLDAHLKSTAKSGGAGGVTEAKRDASRVAALLGDYEKKRGRFTEAAEYYSLAAGQLPADEPRAGFRASLGRVRALIAQPAVDEAFTVAREALERAKGAAGRFDESTDQALTALRQNGRIEIGPRPCARAWPPLGWARLFIRRANGRWPIFSSRRRCR